MKRSELFTNEQQIRHRKEKKLLTSALVSPEKNEDVASVCGFSGWWEDS